VGTRRLTLLRHGEAQASDSCPEDFERTLTRRGKSEAREIAVHIAHQRLVPELILVSPAERAWSTAEIIASACDLDPKQLQCARELYLATPETVWRVLTKWDPALRHVMICGHNPGLSQLASRLGPKPQRRDLPPAGLATAVWHHAEWLSIQPETAASCELDDPESMADLWV
jgi:phosphohistidine phosphatase